MSIFALQKIEAIKGKQEFDKLVVDGKCITNEKKMTREELLKSPSYWTAGLQMELYRQIASFMDSRHMNKSQLAEYLGCSKGYVTQLLNGDFDHKLSKFVELSLAINKIPEITFSDVDEYIHSDEKEYILQANSTDKADATSEMPDLSYLLAA
jgi:transcriptional regulator with XRE-family HTH domain